MNFNVKENVMAEIECVSFKPLNKDKSQLLGFADFFIPTWGVFIYGCTVFVSKEQDRRWVNLPSREYTDAATKEVKYASIVRFGKREHQEAFSSAAIRAVDKWIETNKDKPKEQKVAKVEKTEEVPF